MVYKDIGFFNVSELERCEYYPGLRLQRFPEQTRNKLGRGSHIRGRFIAQASTGCEIRFVTDSKVFHTSLSVLEEDCEVLIYQGNFFHSKHMISAGKIHTLHIEQSPKMDGVKNGMLEGYSFSSRVWRIIFSDKSCAVFHGIDTLGFGLRPPRRNEVPKLRWLAYGSSITMGTGSLSRQNSYIQQAARRLGVDVMCKGLGGACHIEKEIIDYFAGMDDWDFISLEMGINMLNCFDSDQFLKRVDYALKAIQGKKHDKHIVIITSFPSFHGCQKKDDELYERNIVFRDILYKMYEKYKTEYLHIVDGKDILNDFSGLCTDLLHPSDYGHILMGQNLAKSIRELGIAVGAAGV